MEWTIKLQHFCKIHKMPNRPAKCGTDLTNVYRTNGLAQSLLSNPGYLFSLSGSYHISDNGLHFRNTFSPLRYFQSLYWNLSLPPNMFSTKDSCCSTDCRFNQKLGTSIFIPHVLKSPVLVAVQTRNKIIPGDFKTS